MRKDVPRLTAPKWPELSMASIWPRIQNDREILSYFPPEMLQKKKLPNRDFFRGVLFKVRASYCEALIKEAVKKR